MVCPQRIFNLCCIVLGIREVSFFTTRGAPGIWGAEHMNFGNQKGEQKNFWYLKGGGGGGNRRILQILFKKKLKIQNINLYQKNVT